MHSPKVVIFLFSITISTCLNDLPLNPFITICHTAFHYAAWGPLVMCGKSGLGGGGVGWGVTCWKEIDSSSLITDMLFVIFVS